MFSASISTGAWTLVLQEILQQASRSPYSMVSGLCLLTELLPIPLPHTVRQVRLLFFCIRMNKTKPIHVFKELSTHQCNLIRDDFQRYHDVLHHIWSQDSTNKMQKIVQCLSHTSSTVMQEILRRLCMQLIDLGPKLAKNVMK